jgi:hypothetical protein
MLALPLACNDDSKARGNFPRHIHDPAFIGADKEHKDTTVFGDIYRLIEMCIESGASFLSLT